jgi:flagellar basal body-associated protein FliL
MKLLIILTIVTLILATAFYYALINQQRKAFDFPEPPISFSTRSYNQGSYLIPPSVAATEKQQMIKENAIAQLNDSRVLKING